MTSQKLIGVSMRSAVQESYKENRNVISQNWMVFLHKHNVAPVLIPNHPEIIQNIFSKISLQGLILSNGNDVGDSLPSSFPKDSVDRARDFSEKIMVDLATKQNVPIFGVCRGMQFLNLYFGGKNDQNIHQKKICNQEHVNITHTINLESLKWIGKKEIEVNSFHCHGIQKEGLSNDFLSIAFCENIVEAMVHKTLPILAVQWHPERPNSGEALVDKMFDCFLNGGEEMFR